MRKLVNVHSSVKWSALALLLVAFVLPALAQAADKEKEKPRMYSYVALWEIPRTQWGEMEKTRAVTKSAFDQAMGSGALVAYGDDDTLVHRVDGSTHDTWWSSMSLAGLLNTLDAVRRASLAGSPVLSTAPKHWDAVFVSRHYNWKPGTYKGAYTRGYTFKLKKEAPEDAVAKLSDAIFVPTMEKLLAEGVIFEYEVDTEAIHTMDPDFFWLFVITQNAEGLDKVNAALREAGKANPLMGAAFEAYTDYKGHRDDLARTNATYK